MTTSGCLWITASVDPSLPSDEEITGIILEYNANILKKIHWCSYRIENSQICLMHNCCVPTDRSGILPKFPVTLYGMIEVEAEFWIDGFDLYMPQHSKRIEIFGEKQEAVIYYDEAEHAITIKSVRFRSDPYIEWAHFFTDVTRKVVQTAHTIKCYEELKILQNTGSKESSTAEHKFLQQVMMPLQHYRS